MRRETLIGLISLLPCLNHSSSVSSTSLRSGFTNCIILEPFCSNALFPNCLDRRIYKSKFPTHVSFVFFVFCFQYHFTFLSTLKNCFLKNKKMVEFPEQFTSWRIIIELMIESVVISEADAYFYIILSKADKHVPYGKLVGTTEL